MVKELLAIIEQKVLVSPNFLFRVELDPADTSPGGVRQVSDIELASRLSFFLWSSIPDDELLTIAEGGKLRDPAILEGQVRRMLADPRSRALVQNFPEAHLIIFGDRHGAGSANTRMAPPARVGGSPAGRPVATATNWRPFTT
jgi:hypothetical protein